MEFRESGWDVKRLHKLLLMSATYRQSSRVTPALLAEDPENRLYARFPRTRLPAMILRDLAPSASGLIDLRVGGMLERGTRFVPLMHSGWDQHANLYTQLETQCVDTDQPSAALVKDLKRLGLLDSTLVVWGGEFGRMPFGQGPAEKPNGRDHFGRAFSLWMAGGGVKAGHVHGATDEFAWNIVKDPVQVHDHQATILHLLGIDHTKLTYRYQGRQFRLTDVHGEVVKSVVG